MFEPDDKTQKRLQIDLEDRSSLIVETIGDEECKELVAYKLGRLQNEFRFSVEMGTLGLTGAVRDPDFLLHLIMDGCHNFCESPHECRSVVERVTTIQTSWQQAFNSESRHERLALLCSDQGGDFFRLVKHEATSCTYIVEDISEMLTNCLGIFFTKFLELGIAADQGVRPPFREKAIKLVKSRNESCFRGWQEEQTNSTFSEPVCQLNFMLVSRLDWQKREWSQWLRNSADTLSIPIHGLTEIDSLPECDTSLPLGQLLDEIEHQIVRCCSEKPKHGLLFSNEGNTVTREGFGAPKKASDQVYYLLQHFAFAQNEVELEWLISNWKAKRFGKKSDPSRSTVESGFNEVRKFLSSNSLELTVEACGEKAWQLVDLRPPETPA